LPSKAPTVQFVQSNFESKPVTLSEQLVSLSMRPVDAAARRRAALHLIDWLGCALAGSVSQPALIARRVFGNVSGPARLVGGGRASPQDAAYLNGIPGNVLEMDDVHRRAILHPAPTVVPALLAAAGEATTPQAFLDALVRGYEAVIRIGRALGPAHYAFFHNTATAGPFGAAMAAGSLFGLTQAQMVCALGNAGTVAAGLWQCRHEAVMTKQLHCAHAAQAGFLAAALAREGFTGPATLLDGPQGFFAALCKDGDKAAVTHGMEDDWLIHEVSFKPWPACRHAHPAIDAARLAKQEIAGRTIRAIRLETYRDAIEFCDKPTPADIGEAKFSLQHAVAIALHRDAPALADFEPPAIGDAAIVALRAKVSVAESTDITQRYPGHFGARIAITLTDGTELRAETKDALGDPEYPLDDAAILGKAVMLAASVAVPKASADLLFDSAARLPTAQTLKPFLAAVEMARPALFQER
jgi:2-methylcitrate dehydratase PrpD